MVNNNFSRFMNRYTTKDQIAIVIYCFGYYIISYDTSFLLNITDALIDEVVRIVKSKTHLAILL